MRLALATCVALVLTGCADDPSYGGRPARESAGGGGGSGAPSGSAPTGEGSTEGPSTDTTPTPVKCEATGERYGSLSVNGAKTDRPAAQHGDLNIELRRYQPAPGGAARGLVDVGGPTDARAPKLTTVLGRAADFVDVYQVQGWDWDKNTASDFMTKPEVTLGALRATDGEIVHVPRASYDIGDGYQALVLYASTTSLTLKYTREDNVVGGYAIHFTGMCTDKQLLADYESANNDGRGNLPAVKPEQPIGRARDGKVLVAVRDTGAWMDPRVRKDWW